MGSNGSGGNGSKGSNGSGSSNGVNGSGNGGGNGSSAGPSGVFAQQHPMVGEFLTSGISVGTGVLLTNPVDVVKIRQQVGQNSFQNPGI